MNHLTELSRWEGVLPLRAVLAAAMAAVFVLALSTAARSETIVVNSLADPGAAGTCGLRDAMTAANTMRTMDGCAAGKGHDTIRFHVTGTIQLASTLPQVTGNLTIDGPVSPGITIDGGSAVQVMQVASGATLSLENMTIADGNTGNNGGGILNQGTLKVTNSTLSGNFSANQGGGIWNGGSLIIAKSTFSGNSSFFGQGGGIWNSGTVTVINSSFFGNGTFDAGGGIGNFGTLTITDSTFTGNVGRNRAGGIYNDGTLTITDCTFSGNSSGFIGGGAILNDRTLTILNSTFSGNSTNFGNGGGILNDETLTVSNSTFSGNSSSLGAGGGIYNLDSVSLKSTILAGNNPGNCSGTIGDAGYNISDDATCEFSATGSQNNTNPMLDPGGLENNGGRTETISLVPGSPAIDAIPLEDCTDQDLNAINTDQRGALRPDAGEVRCDIGAYEFQDFAGQPNCHHKSVSALVRQFGSVDAAAAALDFPSEKALLNAIRTSCGE